MLLWLEEIYDSIPNFGFDKKNKKPLLNSIGPNLNYNFLRTKVQTKIGSTVYNQNAKLKEEEY